MVQPWIAYDFTLIQDRSNADDLALAIGDQEAVLMMDDVIQTIMRAQAFDSLAQLRVPRGLHLLAAHR